MFTHRMVSMFINLNRFANIFGSSPFRLNQSKGQLYIHFWSHFRVLHFSIWMLTYGAIVLPTHIYILYNIGDTRKIFFVIVIIHACVGCNMFSGIFALRSLGFCQFLNGLFRYLQNFEQKYAWKITKNDQGPVRIFEIF